MKQTTVKLCVQTYNYGDFQETGEFSDQFLSYFMHIRVASKFIELKTKSILEAHYTALFGNEPPDPPRLLHQYSIIGATIVSKK